MDFSFTKTALFCCFFYILFSCEKKQNSTKKTQEITLQPLISTKKMVLIEAGKYQPFYGKRDSLISVAAFYLDETPVTNGEFLDFLQKNPQWRRSQVKKLYADSLYLKDWRADLQLPKNADKSSPITQISWYAAKAYAKSVGKRLPTLDEWEYVAQADETEKNATKKRSYSAHIINLYNEKGREKHPIKNTSPNAFGVYNMFDLVWEWTDDFNSILTTGDSRTSVYDDKQLNCASAAISANDVYNYAAFMRFALRTSVKANYSLNNLGFRCAKNLN